MGRGIYAVIEHRKLMELKNCGAIDDVTLESLAEKTFKETKDLIVEGREAVKTPTSRLKALISLELPLKKEVNLMFPQRGDLVDHLNAVVVPTPLCPISEEAKQKLLFIDRAAYTTKIAREVLEMFRRHNEVFVDPERSAAVEWVLQNANNIREQLKEKNNG